MKNKKGFTLIELLAVIVILGILMLISIPNVTKYIEQSRKRQFVYNLDNLVDAARNSFLSEGFVPNDYDTSISARYFRFDSLPLEKGKASEYVGFAIVVVEEDRSIYYVVGNNGKYEVPFMKASELDLYSLQKYQEKSFTYGDVNTDGVVDVFDAACIQDPGTCRNLGNQPTFIYKAADVDQNGEIDVNDVVLIQKCAAGKTTLPCTGCNANDIN